MDRVDEAIAAVRGRASGARAPRDLEVDLHLHPDRLLAGRSVIEHLARDGVYRSQFVTGTSNGGLTAHVGGDRWRWEHRIFGAAYDDAPAAARPCYGALNRLRKPVGAAIRFGSSRLVLADAARARVTYCFPDSADDPQAFATDDVFSLLEIARAADRDALDDYVEAHVHGGVVLDRDVDRIVLDPSFRDTEVEAHARRLPVPVAWHPGIALSVDELDGHADFRGDEVVRLGRLVAVDGRLDARIVGLAAADGHDPQLVKRLWHCVARFGHPIGTDSSSEIGRLEP